jgi:VIT1/CCC1 family predicted Fe2+/Mn2+ transporter
MSRSTSEKAHDGEFHGASVSSRLNWLRAAVLGANDGIVSTAGLVVGVAGATSNKGAILTAGTAGLVAGAVSMALGEYISVSSQRDSERSLLELEARELREMPEVELQELQQLYINKGLSSQTARQVAQELTEHNALAAHAEVELGIDPDDLTNPFHAALASAVAFSVGACLPLLAVLISPDAARVAITMAVVLLALALTGLVSARLGQSKARIAVARIVVGGAAGLALTYAIGSLFGAAVG